MKLIMTIEKHASIGSYKKIIKDQCRSHNASRITIDVHDDEQLYWGMYLRWPYDTTDRPNFVNDIISFFEESIVTKKKALFCLQCEKYQHLQDLAKLVIRMTSFEVRDHLDEYVIVHDPLFMNPVRCELNPAKIHHQRLEKEIRRIRDIFEGVSYSKAPDGTVKYKKEKCTLSNDEIIALRKKQYEYEKQLMEADLDDETIDKVQAGISVGDGLGYYSLTESQKNQIRSKCKWQFVENKVSPRNMWEQITEEEENLPQSLGSQLIVSKPLPVNINTVSAVPLLNDEDNDEFLNKLNEIQSSSADDDDEFFRQLGAKI